MPELYCPASVPTTKAVTDHDSSSSSESDLDSSFEMTSPVLACTASNLPPTLPASGDSSSETSSTSATLLSSESERSQLSADGDSESDIENEQSDAEEVAEVWDSSTSFDDDSDLEFEDTGDVQVKMLYYIVSVFLSFLQLCFNISDKAISFLLKFVCFAKALSLCCQSTNLNKLC